MSFLAVRSVEREEAYLKKQLEDTLRAEVGHITSLINGLLKQLNTELDQTVSLPHHDYNQIAFQWKRRSSFIETPFVLSPQKDIIFPNTSYRLGPKENFFLRWNTAFFKDQESIPVYENIAVAYKDEILNQNTLAANSQMWQSSTQNSSYQIINDIEDQYAQSQFEQYSPLREKVYQQAESKGQKIVYRKVNLPPKGGKNSFSKSFSGKGEKASPPPLESIFISQSRKFSEIITGEDAGIFPRILDGRLRLFFWKKETEGYISGCVIDQDRLVEKIIKLLPDVYSKVRILTILDENGNPLITPHQESQRDWRSPFVAGEISQVLPHWEVVAYLTNPQEIISKANSTAMLVWLLISLLLISIVLGSILILRSLFSEIRLAQQKTTFATNVSHELKTPLTSISMFAEMLRQKREITEQKRRQYLDIILSETERLNRLINNVLDFTKIGQKKKRYTMKKIDIVQLCRQVTEGQRIRLEYKGFTVTLRAQTEPLYIHADEEAIKQVLVNLLSNAEKYSADTKVIDINIETDNYSVLIKVEDKGIGISASNARKIFEAFYRVDDSLTARTRGTGLGLTIARQIIREHQGDISCIPGEDGSMFQIQLPLQKDLP